MIDAVREEPGIAGATDTTPPPSPPLARPGTLTRPLDHKVVGGVAAGLGDYFGIDPILFRAGFVVLTFVGAIGIFLYLLAWLMIPATWSSAALSARRDSRLERTLRRLRGRPLLIGVALLSVGGFLVLQEVGLWHPTMFWAAALIALGVLLLHHQEQRSRTAPSDTEPAPGPGFAPPLEPPSSAGESQASEVLPKAEAQLPTGRQWPFSRLFRLQARSREMPERLPRVPRERSSLGWIALGALLLSVGVVGILQNAGAVELTIAQFLGLALALIGLSLVIGAWWGRARWLIAFGAVLTPLLLAATLIDVPLQGGFGRRVWSPSAIEDVRPVYRLVGGELFLDLTEAPFVRDPFMLTATVAAGPLMVLLPPDVWVGVHARSGAGGVNLFGEFFVGVNVEVDRTFGSPAAARRVILDLETGWGQISVYRTEAVDE